MGDAGYDNGSRNKRIKEEYNVNPIIDIVHRWDKTEKYREIENQPIAYTEEGEVYYIVDLNNYEKMKYLGYDIPAKYKFNFLLVSNFSLFFQKIKNTSEIISSISSEDKFS